MAVKQEYRRRKIATNLLMSAITFCKGNQYQGIELITTACHDNVSIYHQVRLKMLTVFYLFQAREMYLQEGFTTIDSSFKNYYGLGPAQDIYLMYMPLTPVEDEKEPPKLIDI